MVTVSLVERGLASSIHELSAMEILSVDISEFVFGQEGPLAAERVDREFAIIADPREIALDIVESPGARWWFDSVSQSWAPGASSDATARTFPQVFGCERGAWWCEPLYWRSDVFGPCSLACDLIPGSTTPVRRILEDEHVTPLEIAPYEFSEPLSVGSRRLYEINSPSDWVALCLRFPRVVDGLSVDPAQVLDWFLVQESPILQPDWPRVARAFDGVRLSTGGFVSTAYTWFDAGTDYRTTLVGWNPGESVLFFVPPIGGGS
ncbi:hypothetical protein [Gordonia sp. i37]|uniref:hypothetical protein n=1 Tax=Gordonia sp. i37 TaxID=1961707 RepID=UPI00111ABE50|nr:hypothetical protein [Gordonia sp. i37]